MKSKVFITILLIVIAATFLLDACKKDDVGSNPGTTALQLTIPEG